MCLQLLRGRIWPWSVFVGFWYGDYVSQLPYVLVRTVLNMLVRNASPRGPRCFRCLMLL